MKFPIKRLPVVDLESSSDRSRTAQENRPSQPGGNLRGHCAYGYIQRQQPESSITDESHTSSRNFKLNVVTGPASTQSGELYVTIGAVGSTGPPGPNTLAIALLRWYDANMAASFAVGGNPYGIAFDGANIWVVNYGDNTVSKLRASDGAVLGTIPVGGNPYAMAFDGANIWVTNNVSSVTKLNAVTGALIGTYSVGSCPSAIAFDGANIWVTSQCINILRKLRASDGAQLGRFETSRQNECSRG